MEVPKIPELIRVLAKILVEKAPRPCFIIIDALDESDENERAEILDMIRSLSTLDTISIRLLVTSRTTTVGVGEALETATKFFNITIEPENANKDIAAHVTERLQNDETLIKWPGHIRDKIKDTLTGNAAGMFRWVDCQLQAMRKCEKVAELNKTLTSLPKDLQESYTRELSNVEANRSDDVMTILEWLTFPQHPLRIEEVVEILAVDTDSQVARFDEENRFLHPEDVLKVCGSLVRVEKTPEGRNSLGELAEVCTLTAAHASVIDYLSTQPVRVGAKPEVRFTRLEANLRMAETRLIYLLHFIKKHESLTEEIVVEYPFARLSAELWPSFYREAIAVSAPMETPNIARLNILVMDLLSSRESISKWVQLHNPALMTKPVQFELSASTPDSPMFFASLLGLPDIVARLIDEGYPIDRGNPKYGLMPLVVACKHGRKEVVALLLDRGVDPTPEGLSWYAFPLVEAVSNGQSDVAKLLLQRYSVHVSGRLLPSRTVVEPLQRNNVHVSGRLIPSRTVIEPKSHGTSVAAVDLVIYVHESQISAVGSKLLPNAGVSHSMPHEFHDSSFQERVQVKVCSRNGAPECETDRSILSLAAIHSSLEILEILLRAGLDPNTQDREYSTPLMAACWGRSSESKIQMLLKYGAQVNLVSEDFGTALHCAISIDEVSDVLIKTLIANGADVNMFLKHCEWPLNIACDLGKAEIAKILVEAGAEVNATNTKGHSPLHVASFFHRTHANATEILLSLGADHSQLDIDGRSPLHFAARWGRTSAVRSLLDHGADVTGIDRDGWTPLHWAAKRRRNSSKIIRMLLDHGSDDTVKDRWGRTPLDIVKAFHRRRNLIVVKDTESTSEESMSEGSTSEGSISEEPMSEASTSKAYTSEGSIE